MLPCSRMWANYHCHTNYCDGKTSVGEMVGRAVAGEMISIGISSHAPLPFDCKWSMKPGDLESYLSDISEVGKNSTRPEVYAGLEVDFIPGQTGPLLFSSRLDYTIGSIHFVDAFADGRRWEIDGPHQQFAEGLAEIFDNDIKAAVTRYHELTIQMIDESRPDIIGHVDKIKMQNTTRHYFSEQEPWYIESMIRVLKAIRESGCILEVNTRGIYQKKTADSYPGPAMLREALKLGIPVTISSDAHHPDDLINQFPETARELLQIGFKKLRILLNGKWTDVAFDERGIK